jgi:hypothetical protein
MIGLGSDVHSAVPYPDLRVSVVKLLIKTTTETRRALRSFFPTDTYGVKSDAQDALGSRRAKLTCLWLLP